MSSQAKPTIWTEEIEKALTDKSRARIEASAYKEDIRQLMEMAKNPGCGGCPVGYVLLPERIIKSFCNPGCSPSCFAEMVEKLSKRKTRYDIDPEELERRERYAREVEARTRLGKRADKRCAIGSILAGRKDQL